MPGIRIFSSLVIETSEAPEQLQLIPANRHSAAYSPALWPLGDLASVDRILGTRDLAWAYTTFLLKSEWRIRNCSLGKGG